jgi:hypothetical protein
MIYSLLYSVQTGSKIQQNFLSNSYMGPLPQGGDAVGVWILQPNSIY